eukprot:gnl/MRDRNA2_/MRDRNA2_61355_c0_seq1.p1 gnl/MRDRNA2_/MRDRNA2_61355_c0~~gnl/MRDRNA2_/MRDRNA2_61355_c0_seq1.p1  ORF type:complete len:1660 (-),score=244.11 gnl/MRDRNA2_/MRDRNA2_61355_c0_seq1:124-4458(-)
MSLNSRVVDFRLSLQPGCQYDVQISEDLVRATNRTMGNSPYATTFYTAVTPPILVQSRVHRSGGRNESWVELEVRYDFTATKGDSSLQVDCYCHPLVEGVEIPLVVPSGQSNGNAVTQRDSTGAHRAFVQVSLIDESSPKFGNFAIFCKAVDTATGAFQSEADVIRGAQQLGVVRAEPPNDSSLGALSIVGCTLTPEPTYSGGKLQEHAFDCVFEETKGFTTIAVDASVYAEKWKKFMQLEVFWNLHAVPCCPTIVAAPSASQLKTEVSGDLLGRFLLKSTALSGFVSFTTINVVSRMTVAALQGLEVVHTSYVNWPFLVAGESLFLTIRCASNMTDACVQMLLLYPGRIEVRIGPFPQSRGGRLKTFLPPAPLYGGSGSRHGDVILEVPAVDGFGQDLSLQVHVGGTDAKVRIAGGNALSFQMPSIEFVYPGVISPSVGQRYFDIDGEGFGHTNHGEGYLRVWVSTDLRCFNASMTRMQNMPSTILNALRPDDFAEIMDSCPENGGSLCSKTRWNGKGRLGCTLSTPPDSNIFVAVQALNSFSEPRARLLQVELPQILSTDPATLGKQNTPIDLSKLPEMFAVTGLHFAPGMEVELYADESGTTGDIAKICGSTAVISSSRLVCKPKPFWELELHKIANQQMWMFVRLGNLRSAIGIALWFSLPALKIIEVEPKVLPAEGGKLRIYGENFGVPANAGPAIMITFGEEISPCVVTKRNKTLVECMYGGYKSAGLLPRTASVSVRLGYHEVSRDMIAPAQPPCNPGRALTDLGCVPCGPGTYSNEMNSKRCIPCPAKTFTDVARSTKCRPCPPGAHSDLDRVSCACPAGTFRVQDGQGSYTCEACPANAVCNGGEDLPWTAQGFWRDPDSGSVLRCRDPASCIGANKCTPGGDAEIGCAGCLPDHFKDGEDCKECDQALGVLGFIFTTLLVAAATALSFLRYGLGYWPFSIPKRIKTKAYSAIQKLKTSVPNVPAKYGQDVDEMKNRWHLRGLGWVLFHYMQVIWMLTQIDHPVVSGSTAPHFHAVVSLDVDRAFRLHCAFSNGLNVVAHFNLRVGLVYGELFLLLLMVAMFKNRSKKGRLDGEWHRAAFQTLTLIMSFGFPFLFVHATEPLSCYQELMAGPFSNGPMWVSRTPRPVCVDNQLEAASWLSLFLFIFPFMVFASASVGLEWLSTRNYPRKFKVVLRLSALLRPDAEAMRESFVAQDWKDSASFLHRYREFAFLCKKFLLIIGIRALRPQAGAVWAQFLFVISILWSVSAPRPLGQLLVFLDVVAFGVATAVAADQEHWDGEYAEQHGMGAFAGFCVYLGMLVCIFGLIWRIYLELLPETAKQPAAVGGWVEDGAGLGPSGKMAVERYLLDETPPSSRPASQVGPRPGSRPSQTGPPLQVLEVEEVVDLTADTHDSVPPMLTTFPGDKPQQPSALHPSEARAAVRRPIGAGVDLEAA